MKLSIAIICVVIGIEFRVYGSNHLTFDDDFNTRPVHDLHKMNDWDCWYNDYFLKVDHCSSETFKSKEKIQCRQFRGCERQCRSSYGGNKCQVRCKIKENSIPKFIKVIYRVKQEKNCRDTVICVYKTKCYKNWPTYIHQGCYYNIEFYTWWMDHKKAIIKPVLANKWIADNVNTHKNFSPVDPATETTVKIKMNHGNLYHKIGELWIHAKFINKVMFYFIGKIWIPVRFLGKHLYFKIGDKWLRVVILQERFQCLIHNSWIPLKISFGRIYIRLDERWIQLKLENGKYYYEFGNEWSEIKIRDDDIYNKINEKWYKLKIKRNSNLVKLGGRFRKIIIIDKVKHIELGNKWFEFKMKNRKYLIKLDKKWFEIEFRYNNICLYINKVRYKIRFRSFCIYIQIHRKWFQMEAQNKELFFKVNKLWLNLLLKKSGVYTRKNGRLIKVNIDEGESLRYEPQETDESKSVQKMKKEYGKHYSVDNFHKTENSHTFKIIGGHWLPYKKVNGHSLYLLSEKWLRIKVGKKKLFYYDFNQWIEICLIGKTEFNKLNGQWLKVKREKNNFYYYDSNKWHQIKIKGKQIYLRFNKSWKYFNFIYGDKFIRLGNRFAQLNFHLTDENKFYLKMGKRWFTLMIKDNHYLIEIGKTLTRIEFFKHRSSQILLKGVWKSVSFRQRKIYVRNRNCWMEMNLTEKKILLKIGDTFKESDVSNKYFSVKVNGTFFKLFDKNAIKFKNMYIKISYFDSKLHMYINDNWWPLRIWNDKLYVQVEDSWLESYVDKNGEIFTITLNGSKIQLTFENRILCEQYEKVKIPINIRFGKLYYNLDGNWVRIIAKGNLRFLKVNRKLVKINADYLKRKIQRYKLESLSKSKTFSVKERYRKIMRIYSHQRIWNNWSKNKYHLKNNLFTRYLPRKVSNYRRSKYEKYDREKK